MTQRPNVNLNDFVEWANEKPGRTVEIKINPVNDFLGNILIWVYDRDMEVGQLVESIGEIDLQTAQLKKIHQAMAALGVATVKTE